MGLSVDEHDASLVSEGGERDRLASFLRHPLAGSMGAAFGGQATVTVSGVLVSRLLGPLDRGHLALLMLIPLILVQLGGLGLPLALTYEIAGGRLTSRGALAVVRPILGAQLAAILAIHAVVLVLLPNLGGHDVLLAGLTTLAVGPAWLLQQYGLALLQAERRFGAFNFLRVVPSAAYGIAAVVVFVFHDRRLLDIAALWTASWWLSAGLTFAILRPWSGAPGPRPASRHPLLSFGIRGLLGSSAPMDTFRLDQAVVGFFISAYALGLYSAAVAFTSLPRLVTQSIGLVAYPEIASRDPEAARGALRRYCLIGVGAAIVVVVPLIALAGAAVPFFFGAAFRPASVLAQILLVNGLFVSVRRLIGDTVRGTGQPGIGSLGEAVSWIVLVPALAVLIPTDGVQGVAFALVISSVAGLSVVVHKAFLRRPPEAVRAAAT